MNIDGLLAPQRYVDWVNSHLGFNPRSQQNSDALSRFIIDDLCSQSPRLAEEVENKTLEARLNRAVRTRVAERNIDLVFVDPSVSGPLNTVRIAVENKTIMTAHGKARKNRYGDIIAYSNHIHNHSASTIAGAVLVVNVSPNYRNPDPFASELSRQYPNMAKIVLDTIGIFTSIPLRKGKEEPNDQPEALAVLVIDYDGRGPATLVTEPPALQPDHPNHYVSFIKTMANFYEGRF